MNVRHTRRSAVIAALVAAPILSVGIGLGTAANASPACTPAGHITSTDTTDVAWGLRRTETTYANGCVVVRTLGHASVPSGANYGVLHYYVDNF